MGVVLPAQAYGTVGFPAYFTAAKLMQTQGDEFSRVYDAVWFRERIAEFEVGWPDIFNVQPPTMAALMLPVVWAEPKDARLYWSLVSTGALGIWIVGYWRIFRPSPIVLPLLTGLAVLYAPTTSDLIQGQVYSLLSLAAAAVGASVATGRGNTTGGVALGLATITKTALLPTYVGLLARGRHLVVGIATATAVVAAAASLCVIGFEPWVAYAKSIPTFLATPNHSVSAYQTLHSLSLHLFRHDAIWNPWPVVDLPLVAVGVSVTSRVLVLVWATIVARNALPIVSACALLAPVVIVMPVGEDHHFVLLLPALVLAIFHEFRTRQFATLSFLVLSVFLLGLPVHELAPATEAGWHALAAYPRVWGSIALLLWATLKSRFIAPNHYSEVRTTTPAASVKS